MTKPKFRKGQLEFFPDARRPTPEQFASSLVNSGLAPKTVKRKRPVAGKPRTINARKAIESAYSKLEKLQGFDLPGLKGYLNAAEVASTEAIMHNKGIFFPVQRSLAEWVDIRNAVETIVRLVNRKKKHNAIRKAHAASPREYAERAREKRHLKSI